MSGAVISGHEEVDVAAEDLRLGEAEQALGRCAEGLDQPPLVDHDHGVRHRRQYGAHVRFAFRDHALRRTLPGHIHDRQAETTGTTVERLYGR